MLEPEIIFIPLQNPIQTPRDILAHVNIINGLMSFSLDAIFSLTVLIGFNELSALLISHVGQSRLTYWHKSSEIRFVYFIRSINWYSSHLSCSTSWEACSIPELRHDIINSLNHSL